MANRKGNSCDQEPIHLIGSIQSYGYLLCLKKEDFSIIQASKNVEELLGYSIEEILGASIDEFFPYSFLEHFSQHIELNTAGFQMAVGFQLSKHHYVLQTHVYEEYLLLEIEPDDSDYRKEAYMDYSHMVQQLGKQLDQRSEVEFFCHQSLQLLFPVLGFDRLMVYRFIDRGDGEVIAEQSADGENKYLHLQFPASDIPQQARDLYLRNGIRGIWNVEDEPSPIVSLESEKSKALDLSDIFLRSISPVHLTYLRNMGVAASFSISIVVENKLWGLILCHHDKARKLHLYQRRAAAFVGNYISQKINVLLEEDRLRLMQNMHFALRSLGGEMHHHSFADAWQKIATPILKQLQCEGYSLFHRNKVHRHGPQLPQEAEKRLMLQLQNCKSGLFSHFALPQLLSFDEQIELPAGMLAIQISAKYDEWLVLFRPTAESEVRWAGKPQKETDNGHLNPRASFAQWLEQRKGESLPWSAQDLEFAHLLRTEILENMLWNDQSIEVERSFKTERLEERNRELERENQALRLELQRLNQRDAKININREILLSQRPMDNLNK